MLRSNNNGGAESGNAVMGQHRQGKVEKEFGLKNGGNNRLEQEYDPSCSTSV